MSMAMLGISIVHKGLCLEALLAMKVSQSDIKTGGWPLSHRARVRGCSRMCGVPTFRII